ncbi:C-C chemokine receptor type 10 [Rana temporaria]|uniref:C-C chemokine receptor type 10 n=1 Tax=Rana temporaria TaxID=8407 RepID=UPI001AAC7BCB|nr:C-C chemokine receptor type 10 [Rana temporaria]
MDFGRIFQPVIQILVFLIGMSGNTLVLLTYRCSRKIKSKTDIYLINLAIADLLKLMTLPFWTTSAINGWELNNTMCKVAQGVFSINFFSGFLFLTCISLDRYFEIVRAVEAHTKRQKSFFCSKFTSVFVWIASSLLSLPEFIFSESINLDGSKICKMIFPEQITITLKNMCNFFQIVLGFIFPFCVMIVCYSSIIRTLFSCRSFEKHKAMKVIISIVLAFVVFQLPYTLVTFMEATDFIGSKQMSCEVRKHKDIAIIITSNLAFTRCCINPILYAFVGVKFRKDILLVLKNFRCISRASYIRHCGSSRSFSMPAAMETSSFTL